MNKGKCMLLLCVAGVMLAACSQSKENDPKDKTKSTTEAGQEADVVVKYYMNDSLLSYVNFSIVDSLHLEAGALPYSVANLDTLGADASIWDAVLKANYVLNPSLYSTLPPSTIRVITCSQHLSEGSYMYCMRLVRNQKAMYSSTIPVLIVQYSTSSLDHAWSSHAKNEVAEHVTNEELLLLLQRMQTSLKAPISF